MFAEVCSRRGLCKSQIEGFSQINCNFYEEAADSFSANTYMNPAT